MFTGIIRCCGRISVWRRLAHGNDQLLPVVQGVPEVGIYLLQVIYPKGGLPSLKIGDSISVNGVCLTIVMVDDVGVSFHVMDETIRRTTFKSAEIGSKVHLESAATSYDGHVVSGHVLGCVSVLNIIVNSDTTRSFIYFLKNACKYLKPKDSITIDGVSLTVVNVCENSFSVNCIPITLEKTHFLDKKLGSLCNIEFDRLTVSDELQHDLSIDPMTIAIEESKKGRYTAAPNPWVGCCIVDACGNIIATGYHRKRGEKHAERVALEKIPVSREREAPEELIDIGNCTLYCTLEPCCHTGLQPPCTTYLIERGIRRVVVGILDPDTRVSGKGIEQLRHAGIDVVVRDDQQVRSSLKSYIKNRASPLGGSIYITMKLSMSLNGKISRRDGRTTISCAEVNAMTQKYRRRSQAILIGSETALIDNPKLRISDVTTAVDDILRYRIILDRRGRTGMVENRNKITHLWINDDKWQTVVMVGKDCCGDSKEFWGEKGVKFIIVDDCVEKVLKEIAKLGVLYLFIEGGAKIATSFLPYVDKLVVNIAPIIISDGVSAFTDDIEERRMKVYKTQMVGGDVCLKFKH